jgi:hypothetical protein
MVALDDAIAEEYLGPDGDDLAALTPKRLSQTAPDIVYTTRITADRSMAASGASCPLALVPAKVI